MHPALVEKVTNQFRRDRKGCWIWQGYINNRGYGAYTFRGVSYKAHRLSFMIFKGEIKPGLELDHICRVRACINPKHLRAVTRIENMLNSDSTNIVKTHCPNGHSYDRRKKSGIGRFCGECKRKYLKAYYQKHKKRLDENRRKRIKALSEGETQTQTRNESEET